MNKELKEYIEATGFSDLNWRTDHPHDYKGDCRYCFLIWMVQPEIETIYALDFAMIASEFMTIDDLSWSGPVKNWVAWAPITVNKGE